MRKYLASFNPHLPPFELDQTKSISWLTQLHKSVADAEVHEKIEKVFSYFSIKEEKIQTRRTFVNDFTHTNWENHNLIGNNEFNPHLGLRSETAQAITNDIFNNLYAGQNQQPDQIIHVSCTHYQSPSSAQLLAMEKKWFNTPVTHLYHMGCYAALPAIRVASGMLANGNRQVDINHTELCSIHFNPTNNDPEQAVVQTLFADGAIQYQMRDHLISNAVNFELMAQHEILIGNTGQEMKWLLGKNHFDMCLSKKVPSLIKEYITPFFKQLFEAADLNFEQNKEDCEFAIHPGGPKIIDSVAETINLHARQYEKSLQLLRARGNMSSATLPHIWGKIAQEPSLPYVATVAFGPGLTMTGALFKIW